ncbi:MAG: PQQ-binding-like beta-propeller repeat protein, partial [Fimbriiglobus sp.]
RFPGGTDRYCAHHFPDPYTVLFLNRGAEGVNFLFRWIDLRSGQTVAAVPVKLPAAEFYAFRPDGRVLVATTEKAVTAFDVPSGKKLWSVKIGQLSSAAYPKFSPDGRWLAIQDGKTNVLYDPRTGGRMLTLAAAGETSDDPAFLTFSSGGRWLAGCYTVGEESVIVWDTTTGNMRRLAEAKCFPFPVFLGDGTTLLAAHGTRYHRWDLRTGRRGAADPIQFESGGQTVSADGRVIAFAAIATVSLWDLDTGKPLPQSFDPPHDIHGVSFGPHGRVIGRTADESGRAVSWDPLTGAARHLRTWQPYENGIELLSPDERYVVTQSDKGFRLRSTTPRAESKRLVRPAGWDFDEGIGAFSATGNRFVAWADKGVCAWDVPSGRAHPVRLTLTGGDLETFAVSADGHTAAAGCILANDDVQSAIVFVVDFRARKEVARFPVDAELRDVALSADGTRLAALLEAEADAADRDPDGISLRAVVFDARTCEHLFSFAPTDPLESAYSFGNLITFSPDGRVLVVSAGTKAVAWEIVSGKPRSVFAHAGPVGSAAFRPDGRVLAVPSSEAPVYLWDVRGENVPLTEPDRPGLETAWRQLASPNPGEGIRAIRRLARFPAISLPFLRDRLAPAATADPVLIRALAAKLDSPHFHERDAATRDLAAVADQSLPLLRELREAIPSGEAATRLDALIAGARRPTPAAIRVVRAVEAVEWAGTPAARDLLRGWADGADGAWLTREAAAAVRRTG